MMTSIANEIFDAETVSLLLGDKGARPALRPVPVAETFCNDTIEFAASLMDDIIWNVGVDVMATVCDLDETLQADYRLIDSGMRDDDFIRARATATVRRLSAIFIKADKHGLVNYGRCIDPAALSCPDFYDHLSR